MENRQRLAITLGVLLVFLGIDFAGAADGDRIVAVDVLGAKTIASTKISA